jgi:hypothetical protein
VKQSLTVVENTIKTGKLMRSSEAIYVLSFQEIAEMRMSTFLVVLLMTFGFAAGVNAADKDSKSATEAPTEQTGSISGTLGFPSKEAPHGCVAEMKVPAAGAAKGEETVFYLFADGSVGRKLKDLAGKGASATVSGAVTKEGYRVTSISK